MALGRKFKFPTPATCKLGERAILCPGERVIALYNQDSGDTKQRIAKKVRVWFAQQAAKAGWAGVHFLPEVQTGHGAGCVLFLPPQQVNVQINVTSKTLVLLAEDG